MRLFVVRFVLCVVPAILATPSRAQIPGTRYSGRPVTAVQVVIEREDKPPLVTRFGGIALTPEPFAEIEDLLLDRDRLFVGRNEIVQRLLAETCELCGSREDVQVHHVRKLADLKVKGRAERPYYIEVMSSRRRKTLVVCKTCHVAIHAGQPTRRPKHPV